MTLRLEFATLVFNLAQERPADPRNLLNNYFDEKTQAWMSFILDSKSDIKIDDLKNPEMPPIIYT